MARSKVASRSRRRAYEDPGYETRMVAAIRGYRDGIYTSIDAAAKAEHVSRSTLGDRLKGKHKPAQEYSESRQLLTPSQEQVIVDWLGLQALSATPVDYIGLRRYAHEVSGSNVGTKWVRGFFTRHPELVARKPTKLDPKRRDNFNKSVINHYFDIYEDLHRTYDGIPPEHIWNMDEKGIQMGGGRKGSGKAYIYLRKMKNRYRVSSDNLELVTIIECVSAAGDCVPPAFVLSDGPLPDVRDLYPDKVSNVGRTATGWTDNDQAVAWLRDAFIPFAMSKRVDDKKPILLILDGHDTHERPEIKREVYSFGGCDIIVLCFPSKCTHRLQPLDVVIFSPIGRAWRSHCDDLHIRRHAVNRYNVIQEYVKVRAKHMKVSSIQNAFRTTGLFPVSRNAFSDEDFAPSMSSSSIAHVPDSFPFEIPTSPPAIPSDAGSGLDTDDEGVSTQPFLQSEFPSDDEDSDNDFILDEQDDDSGDDDANYHPTPDGSTTDGSTFTLRASLLSKCLDFNDILTKVVNVPRHVDEDKTHLELLDEVRTLRSQVEQLCSALQIREASIQAANAHCTIIKCALADVREQLQNVVKKKERGSKKVKARVLTLPQLKEAFDAEEEERQQQQAEETARQAQKAVDLQEQEKYLQEQAASRIFNHPLHFYFKSRLELRIVARSLGIRDDGTKDNILQLITEHLNSHPDLRTQERFKGLFLPKGTRARKANPPDPTPGAPEVGTPTHNPAVVPPVHVPPQMVTPYPPFNPNQPHLYTHSPLHNPLPYNHTPHAGPSHYSHHTEPYYRY